MLEWFDFAVYGYFATDIGHQFFPQNSAAAQQLYTFGAFALGFFARPFGSLVLGSVGDRIGRRALLTLSIALMGGATLILGLLPTYEQIGVAAPLLLMLMRIVQGFSLGGEFTGSMVYTTEKSSPLMRGLVSSSTAAGTTIGFILGSGAAWLVNASLPADQVATVGLAHPVRGERAVPRRRLPAAPRNQRDRRRAEGRGRFVRRSSSRSRPTGSRSSRRSASSA